ncbi:MAG: deoxyribonuclease IV [Elusimicrobiota bacterium]
MIKLGVHNSINGGVLNVLEECSYLKTNATQFFCHSPRNWDMLEIKNEEAKNFVLKSKEIGIYFIIIHSSYLINPLSENKETIRKSRKLIESELKTANKLSADYYVLHIRCNKNKSIDENIKNAIKFFKDINLNIKTKILLENSASGLTSVIENLIKFYKELKKTGLFSGICLDTAHLFEAGYDIRKKEDLERIKKEVKDLQLIKLIHLNDSKTKLSSRIDRHDHIGKGEIKTEGFKNFFSITRFKEIPIILETPKKSLKDDLINLSNTRKILNSI